MAVYRENNHVYLVLIKGTLRQLIIEISIFEFSCYIAKGHQMHE